MREFTVRMDNRPGMLAALTEEIAEAGINIEAVAAMGINGDGMVRLVVADGPGTRRVLRKAGISFEERPVLTTLLTHKPGDLARMARRLADAHTNIDAIYLLHSTAAGLEFAVGIDDPDATLDE